jgi:hypothetical protein
MSHEREAKGENMGRGEAQTLVRRERLVVCEQNGAVRTENCTKDQSEPKSSKHRLLCPNCLVYSWRAGETYGKHPLLGSLQCQTHTDRVPLVHEDIQRVGVGSLGVSGGNR